MADRLSRQDNSGVPGGLALLARPRLEALAHLTQRAGSAFLGRFPPGRGARQVPSAPVAKVPVGTARPPSLGAVSTSTRRTSSQPAGGNIEARKKPYTNAGSVASRSDA
jgi:hypothetical protein